MESKVSYYAVLPSPVRHDEELSPNAKLLYAELTAMVGTDGYCWATNKYFAELYNLSETTVSKLISSLAQRGYIRIEQSANAKGSERHIYAGSFVVHPADEGSCQKGQEGVLSKTARPPRGSCQKSQEGSCQKRQAHKDNNLNLNSIDPPIVPPAKLKNAEKEEKPRWADYLSNENALRIYTYAGRDFELREKLLDFAEFRHKKRKTIQSRQTVTLLLNKLDKLSGGRRGDKLAIIDQSIENSWTGLFGLKGDYDAAPQRPAQVADQPGVAAW